MSDPASPASQRPLWFRHPEHVWARGALVAQEGSDRLRVRELDSNVEHLVRAGFACCGGACRGPRPDLLPAPRQVKVEDTQSFDPTHDMDMDDLARMNNLHEAPLLDLLRRRYAKDEIYTYVADILISLNPYKFIERLYKMPEELSYAEDEEPVPHVYAVADRAYRCMVEARELGASPADQSLIVSGESGAGKTEGCKYVMNYLAALSEKQHRLQQAHDTADNAPETVRIETRVLACNPFLEAFGNAKTVRNNNSSRFGKFLKIEYRQGRIVGASMEQYLLEKARLVAQGSGERNYHVFYQLCRGASADQRRQLHLRDPTGFRYLVGGGCDTVEGADDAADFAEVTEALGAVGIGAEERDLLWRVLAGVLLLGELRFQDLGEAKCEVTNAEEAAQCGEMLGTPASGFGCLPDQLCKRLVVVPGRGSVSVVTLTGAQAADARDALAKAIYGHVFAWLVARANASLTSTGGSDSFIGILDIFGFEIFEHNSFEQLCINFTNEKLQSLFNRHVFVLEQETYLAEGVSWSHVDFQDNQPCVDLIEKPRVGNGSGILPSLDDICRTGRDVPDSKFMADLTRMHRGNHPYFDVPRFANNQFVVKHFAGDVTYVVDGFIEKNRDTLFHHLASTMKASDNAFLADIFAHPPGEPKPEGDGQGGGAPPRRPRRSRAGGGKAISTIAGKFKAQLGELMATLEATQPHYVRCVKPNTVKRPQVFESRMVLDQLLYSGVLETVRIRRMGYPFREPFEEFARRAETEGWAQALAPAEAAEAKRAGPRDSCHCILRAALPEGQWVLGKTKVFMKDSALAAIRTWHHAHVAVQLQAWWRMVHARRRIRRLKRAVCAVQRRWRALLMVRLYEKKAAEVVRIQAVARGACARRRVAAIRAERRRRQCAVTLQAAARGFLARSLARSLRHVRHRHRCATIIQAAARGMRARSLRRRLETEAARSATILQAAARGMQARRAIARRHRAACQVQALVRGVKARRAADERFWAVVCMQALARRGLERRRFLFTRQCTVRLQTWLRMAQARWAFAVRRAAVRRVGRALRGWAARGALHAWNQEVHAAASWGQAAELRALLACEDSRYARLRRTPDLASLRSTEDGLKTPLHSAAAGGSLPCVDALLAAGADPCAADLSLSTPLHKACAMGDSHLPCAQRIYAAAPRKQELLAACAADGATALDVAVAAEGGAESDDGSRRTVQWLASLGAPSALYGDADEATKAAEAERRRADAVLAMQEREETQSRTRRASQFADPHYAFLLLSKDHVDPEVERIRGRKRERAAVRLQALYRGHLSRTGRVHRMRAPPTPPTPPPPPQRRFEAQHPRDPRQPAQERQSAAGRIPDRAPSPPPGAPSPVRTAQRSAWRAHAAADGRRYFYNLDTMETQWKRPPEYSTDEEEEEAEGGIAADGLPVAEADAEPGANGWHRVRTGKKVYYFHEPTGRSQWRQPDDFDPAARAAEAHPASRNGAAPPPPGRRSSRQQQHAAACRKAHGLLLHALQCLQEQATAEEARGWYYQDERGRVHGPFPGETMQAWYAGGTMEGDTPVRSGDTGPFVPLTMLFPDPEDSFEDMGGGAWRMQVRQAMKAVEGLLASGSAVGRSKR